MTQLRDLSEMPQYASTYTVQALKIGSVEPAPAGCAYLTPEDRSFPRIHVDRPFMSRHTPEPRGYYITSGAPDEYETYMSGPAFEACFTPIQPEDPDESS